MVQFNKIAIIGVGLIGGSLGKAIKKRRLAKRVVGVVRREISLKNALKYKAVDKATMNIKDGVSDADLVILAVSVDKIIPFGLECYKFMKPGAILMDVGSVKEKIVTVLSKNKPSGINFIGAHPMAGSEKSGVSEANPGLFNGSICILATEKPQNRSAFIKIENFWKSLGCRRIEKISSPLHDKFVAQISHTPHLISWVLSKGVDKNACSFASTGFKDTTRLALSDIKLWSEIFLMNRVNEIEHLRQIQKIIGEAIGLLSQNDEKGFRNFLKKAKINKLKIDQCRKK